MPRSQGPLTAGAAALRKSRYLPTAAASLAPAPSHLFVGTSGWAYPTWKPAFYPPEVPSRAFLHVYASKLTSVEVNYTFRKLPTVAQLEGWLSATPPGFRFSFKAPQGITHFSRLRNAHGAVDAFVQSLAPIRHAGRLGPLLFQLPPNFASNTALLADLLAAPALRSDATASPVQVAFEFRHPSWFAEETFAILRAHNAALCVAEGDSLVTPDVPTATFHCYRLRRSGGYTSRQLSGFAKRLVPLALEGELYIYFKHEDEPTGALNAVDFLKAANRLSRGLQSAGPARKAALRKNRVSSALEPAES